MNEYSIEIYIARDEKENIKLSALNDYNIEKWKEVVETKALSEYYNKKIKIAY